MTTGASAPVVFSALLPRFPRARSTARRFSTIATDRRSSARDLLRNFDISEQSAVVAVARIDETAVDARQRHFANRITRALGDSDLNGAILIGVVLDGTRRLRLRHVPAVGAGRKSIRTRHHIPIGKSGFINHRPSRRRALQRDSRFGKRPCHVGHVPDRFAFSHERTGAFAEQMPILKICSLAGETRMSSRHDFRFGKTKVSGHIRFMVASTRINLSADRDKACLCDAADSSRCCNSSTPRPNTSASGRSVGGAIARMSAGLRTAVECATAHELEYSKLMRNSPASRPVTSPSTCQREKRA